MSHEVETMAFANEVPWHGLGANIRPDSTPDEMLQVAGLDWEIRRMPLFTKMDGNEIRIPGRKALVRSSDNKVMTIAGQDWKPLQNRDLLSFFQEYCDAGGVSLETAGSLRGGSVVWALANLKDGFTIGNRDHVKGYLLFTSPHKVGASINIRTTTIRVVCANTMALAERGGTVHYRQNHLSAFNATAAQEAVERAHEGLKAAGQRARTLSRLKLSVEDRVRVLAPFFGAGELSADELADSGNYPKKLTEVLASVEHAPGAQPGTGWGVLNGVTHWADHVNGRNNATRMFRSWVGDVAKLKLDVEHELLELT